MLVTQRHLCPNDPTVLAEPDEARDLVTICCWAETHRPAMIDGRANKKPGCVGSGNQAKEGPQAVIVQRGDQNRDY